MSWAFSDICTIIYIIDQWVKNNFRCTRRLAIKKDSVHIKEEKNSVAIFPEGYVSLSGDLLPFRNGAFKIATKSGTKIVVCTLCGTKEIVKKMFRRRHDVYFDVLAVIDAKDIKHTAELGEEIHKLMLDNILKRKEG